MWISPIEIINGDIELRLEDTVFKAVQSVGIKVNKDELLKALAYDRGQYEKGYADGIEDAESKIVRCKDCVHRQKESYGPDSTFYAWCRRWREYTANSGFCYLGKPDADTKGDVNDDEG